MNILVTGSSGFIANHLINKLIDKNNIIGIDLKKSKNTSFIHDLKKNIKSSKFPRKLNLIIHLAAVHKEPGHKPHEYFETNIKSALNLCKLADDVNCNQIIFISSIASYGISNKIKCENTIPCPNSPYGSSKLVAEQIFIAWQNRDIKNRILTIVRPGVVFGKGENGNMSRLVQLIYKNFFFYMGNKDINKSGIYVKELVNQIIWVYEKQLKNIFPKIILFNATIWPNPSISDYVNTVKKVAGINRFVPSVPYWILLSASIAFEFLSNALGKKNLFSKVRLRKLVKPNLIKPSFLLQNKYIPLYTLRTAFEDWKKEDPDVWPKK